MGLFVSTYLLYVHGVFTLPVKCVYICAESKADCVPPPLCFVLKVITCTIVTYILILIITLGNSILMPWPYRGQSKDQVTIALIECR